MSSIRAYVNCDQAYVVWQLDAAVPGCRGFALKRRVGDSANVEILDTWVGFAGDTAPSGTKRPSTEWPIQKFMWSDYSPPHAHPVRYQAVPMVGAKDALVEDAEHATDWSEPVTVTADVGSGVSAFFNRGVVASQWLSRALRAAGAENTATLTAQIEDPASGIRRFLGGAILRVLPTLLTEADQAGTEIYAALFELRDPVLKERLKAFQGRAHVVLANGTKDSDANSDARAELKAAGVDVHDRLVDTHQHFAHNKFLVLCDTQGPRAVWTGSTNWTPTGLCTQSNNALLIENREVAARFRREWDELVAAGSDYPAELFAANHESETTSLAADGPTAQTWFAPVRDTVDLESARERINAAKQGILFLMLNPGPAGTLLNDILLRTTPASLTYDANLHIHGVLNQDPGTAAHPVALFHRGEVTPADIDVVLPAAVDADFAFWLQELTYSIVRVHSKCIVLDPFGDEPVVMTGSHNLGPKASGKNDDNLVIVEHAPKLAEAYAVNIMSVYNQYRWRYYQKEAENGARPATAAAEGAVPTWAGLQDGAAWQDKYFAAASPEGRELEFWLGAKVPAPAPVG